MIAAQLDGAATGISDSDEWTSRTAVGRVDEGGLVFSSGATAGHLATAVGDERPRLPGESLVDGRPKRAVAAATSNAASSSYSLVLLLVWTGLPPVPSEVAITTA